MTPNNRKPPEGLDGNTGGEHEAHEDSTIDTDLLGKYGRSGIDYPGAISSGWDE